MENKRNISFRSMGLIDESNGVLRDDPQQVGEFSFPYIMVIMKQSIGIPARQTERVARVNAREAAAKLAPTWFHRLRRFV